MKIIKKCSFVYLVLCSTVLMSMNDNELQCFANTTFDEAEAKRIYYLKCPEERVKTDFAHVLQKECDNLGYSPSLEDKRNMLYLYYDNFYFKCDCDVSECSCNYALQAINCYRDSIKVSQSIPLSVSADDRTQHSMHQFLIYGSIVLSCGSACLLWYQAYKTFRNAQKYDAKTSFKGCGLLFLGLSCIAFATHIYTKNINCSQ